MEIKSEERAQVAVSYTVTEGDLVFIDTLIYPAWIYERKTRRDIAADQIAAFRRWRAGVQGWRH